MGNSKKEPFSFFLELIYFHLQYCTISSFTTPKVTDLVICQHGLKRLRIIKAILKSPKGMLYIFHDYWIYGCLFRCQHDELNVWTLADQIVGHSAGR